MQILSASAYLDTCVISGLTRNDISQGDGDALWQFVHNSTSKSAEFVTSSIAWEELQRIPQEYRSAHAVTFDLFPKIKTLPGPGITQIGPTGTPHGNPKRRLWARLRGLLPDEVDAEHVFQAASHGIEYFVTVDVNTILRFHEELWEKAGVRAVSPRQLFVLLNEIEVPDPHLPSDIHAALERYLEIADDDIGSVAHDGPDIYDRNGELFDTESLGARPSEIRLHAALLEFEREPANGFKYLNLADAFAENGDIDATVQVLEELSRLGCLGLYGVWYENPHFQAGWYLADAGRSDEAIEQYHRALSSEVRGRRPIWTHIASVYHMNGDYDEALAAWQNALDAARAEDRQDVRKTRRCLEAARMRVALSLSRTEHGVFICE